MQGRRAADVDGLVHDHASHCVRWGRAGIQSSRGHRPAPAPRALHRIASRGSSQAGLPVSASPSRAGARPRTSPPAVLGDARAGRGQSAATLCRDRRPGPCGCRHHRDRRPPQRNLSTPPVDWLTGHFSTGKRGIRLHDTTRWRDLRAHFDPSC